MSPSDLSYDLVRILVDLVHNEHDISALQSCALVNHLWWLASRPSVFHRIKLIDRNGMEAFERMLDSDSDIGPMVDTLVIQPIKEPTVFHDWITDLVCRLPARLPRLQTIEIADLIEDGTVCTQEFFYAFGKFATVSALRLHGCMMELRMLYSFVCSLPGLRQLHVGPIITSHNWQVDIPPPLPPPILTTLSLAVQDCETEDIAEILEWAVGHSSATLATFKLNIEYLQSESVATFFEEHGPLVEHLAVTLVRSVTRLWEYNLIKGEIDIGSCTRLSSLVLHGFNPGSPAFVDFVMEIASPIKNLTIEYLSNDFHDSIPDFTSLGKALEGRNVASLQKVTVVCQGLVDTNALMSKVRHDMAAVCERVVVQVFRTSARRD